MKNGIVAWLILINIGAGSGMAPDGKKPFHEPMLPYFHISISALIFA